MTRRPDLLADPAQSAAFMRGVRRPAPRPRLHALGGSGVLARWEAASIAVDPYLLNTLGDLAPDAPHGWRDRSAPPPVTPEDLNGLSAILITHGHGDHFDPPTLEQLLRVNPGVTLVLPRALRDAALALGFTPDHLRHPLSLSPLTLAGGGVVTAVPAAHTPPEQPQPQPDGAGGHSEVGYLLRLGHVTLYHAGDTVVYPELPDLIRGADAAVLPVNGRRWSPLQPARRGNLTGEEAADLAGVSGVRAVLPVHHDLLGSSAGGLEAFVLRAAACWPLLDVVQLAAGAAWTLDDGGRERR